MGSALTEFTDVLIVGAGPAGSQLALRLAREGVRVALVERRTFPRPKPCGEFMSPQCLPLLEDLGLREMILARGARKVFGMELHGHGRSSRGDYRSLGGASAPADHGYALRREVLDELSFRAAVAAPEVRPWVEFDVRGLLREDGGRVLGARLLGPDGRFVDLRAGCTIGADGLRSRVARELGVHRGIPWLRKFALVAHFAGVAPRDRAEVHFVPGGYMAASPVDAGLFTLNLVVDQSALPAGHAALGDFMEHQIASAPVLRSRMRDARRIGEVTAIGPLAGTTTSQIFDGAALVGDACGHVDPVTGEGLFFAMRGAKLLADHLVPALRQGRCDRRALRGYARARFREFGPRYLMARALQRGLRHPAIVRRTLGLLQDRPQLADLLVALTGDYVPPSALLSPRLWWSALTGPRSERVLPVFDAPLPIAMGSPSER